MDETSYAKCSCPNCRNHVAFPVAQVGAVIDCPHCARPFKLYGAAPPTSGAPAAPLDLPTIESAFHGSVDPFEPTRGYKAGLILVAAAMVLMVLLYAALIAGASIGLVWHATHHYSLIARPRVGVFMSSLLYVVPLVILLLLVLFLLKPLFARRAPRPALLALNPEVEPLLYGCFHLGRAASSFLSRQMEFDADRCQFTVAGSPAFESAFRRMRFLERATSRAYEVLRSLFHQGKILPPNFPAFVLEQETRLDSYVRSRIEAAMATQRRKLFDSHPPDGERVPLARQAAAPGLVQLPGQASELLGNFAALATQITALHYAEDLHLPTGQRVLVSGGGE